MTGAVPPAPASSWYVQQARNPITVDGYGDDWAPLTPWSQPLGPARPRCCWPRTRIRSTSTWMCRDTRRTRADAGDANALAADHLILSLANETASGATCIASAAPGPVLARPLDPSIRGPARPAHRAMAGGRQRLPGRTAAAAQPGLAPPRRGRLRRRVPAAIRWPSRHARCCAMATPFPPNWRQLVARPRAGASAVAPGLAAGAQRRTATPAGHRRSAWLVRLDDLPLAAGHPRGGRQPVVAGCAAAADGPKCARPAPGVRSVSGAAARSAAAWC